MINTFATRLFNFMQRSILNRVLYDQLISRRNVNVFPHFVITRKRVFPSNHFRIDLP